MSDHREFRDLVYDFLNTEDHLNDDLPDDNKEEEADEELPF